MFETGTNQWRALRRLAAQGGQREKSLLSPSDGRLSLRAARTEAARVRRVRQRPGQAGAGVPNSRHRHDRATTWSTISGSPSSRPDVLVYQTDVLEEDVTIAGPIAAAAARVDHRHGFGLGREADRRLFGRLSQSRRPIPAGVQMGGYQQLVRGEAMRGKFRNSYEKPGAVPAGQGHEVEVRDARRLPHVSPRPSHHGPGAKLVVPAGGSQSAEVLRHLSCPRRGFSEGDATGLSVRTASLLCTASGFGVVSYGRVNPKHMMFEPTASATYCSPLTQKVIGEGLDRGVQRNAP